jgi:hypothetical protein
MSDDDVDVNAVAEDFGKSVKVEDDDNADRGDAADETPSSDSCDPAAECAPSKPCEPCEPCDPCEPSEPVCAPKKEAGDYPGNADMKRLLARMKVKSFDFLDKYTPRSQQYAKFGIGDGDDAFTKKLKCWFYANVKDSPALMRILSEVSNGGADDDDAEDVPPRVALEEAVIATEVAAAAAEVAEAAAKKAVAVLEKKPEEDQEQEQTEAKAGVPSKQRKHPKEVRSMRPYEREQTEQPAARSQRKARGVSGHMEYVHPASRPHPLEARGAKGEAAPRRTKRTEMEKRQAGVAARGPHSTEDNMHPKLREAYDEALAELKKVKARLAKAGQDNFEYEEDSKEGQYLLSAAYLGMPRWD